MKISTFSCDVCVRTVPCKLWPNCQRQQCDKFHLLFFTSFFTTALKLQTAIFDASPSFCKKTPKLISSTKFTFSIPHLHGVPHWYPAVSGNSSISANRGLIETLQFFTVSSDSSSSSAYVNISSKSSPSRWPLGAVAAGYPSFPMSNITVQLSW